MRLRSLHPSYLDSKGLVALWRESLLAQHVLAGKTKGYTNHPQLDRFKNLADPLSALNQYLVSIVDEADVRGYHFDRSKIDTITTQQTLTVTDGQLQYEYHRLLSKLKTRDPEKYQSLTTVTDIITHPMFTIETGPIASWEKIAL